MNAKVGMTAIGSLTILVLSSSTPALADECAAPLVAACATDTVPLDPDDVLDDPVGTIVDTVDGTDDTTDPVVDPVVDLVDDLLPGDGIVDPPGGDGPGAHHGGRDPRIGGHGGRTPDPSVRTPSAGDALTRESVRPSGTIIGSAASGTNPAVAPHGVPGRTDEIVRGAVRGLLLLAVLFGVTIGFVLVQGRLDRNDPKLAAASVRAEVVTFG